MLSPHCQVLMKIAQTTAKKNPDVATSALEQVRKDSEILSLRQQGHFLIDAADLYLKMAQSDEATKTRLETMKIAESSTPTVLMAMTPTSPSKAYSPRLGCGGGAFKPPRPYRWRFQNS